MKRYIKSDKTPWHTTKGTIAETGEPCVMQPSGNWAGAGGRQITSYLRVDKPDYNERGERVFRQYSRDRHHRFYVETEDRYEDYMDDWIIYNED